MNRKTLYLTQGAIIAAAYVVLTLPFAQFAFGPVQFRLAEALNILAVMTPAAIPGLFIGCLLTNTIYPSGLGMIDIIFGSLATLLAASLIWWLQQKLRLPFKSTSQGNWIRQIIVLFPPVIVNALIVGTYLPFLIPETPHTIYVIGTFIGQIFLSEAIVIYLIGWPLLVALRKARLDIYLSGERVLRR
jgi:uncharacterized membrane protein